MQWLHAHKIWLCVAKHTHRRLLVGFVEQAMKWLAHTVWLCSANHQIVRSSYWMASHSM